MALSQTGGTPIFDAIEFFVRQPAVQDLSRALLAGKRIVATGSVGSSTALACGALAKQLDRPVVLVTAHLDDADEAGEELAGTPGLRVVRLPAVESLTTDTGLATDTLAHRLRVARLLPSLKGPAVLLAPIQALMQLLPPIAALESLTRTLRTGEKHKVADLVAWLSSAGYKRVEAVEEVGDFALRGGILDVFPPTPAAISQDGSPVSAEPVPVRLDFFGDEVEKLSEVDVETMGSDRALQAVEVVAASVKGLLEDPHMLNVLELVPREAIAVLAETMEVVEQGRGYFERVTDSRGIAGPPAVLRLLEQRFHAFAEINQFSAGATLAESRLDLPVSPLPTFSRDAQQAVTELAQLAAEDGARVVVACQNDGERHRLGELLAEFAKDAAGRVESVPAYIHRGFVWRGESAAGAQHGSAQTPAAPSPAPPTLSLVPYHELLSRFTVRRSARQLRAARTMDTFLDFDAGDYVVHQDHGIAVYDGLALMRPRDLPVAQRHVANPIELRKETATEPEEYLILEFASKSRLYVPASQVDRVQKYVGGFSGKPPLSVLGGQKWKNQKERVAESVRDLAGELLRVRAAREHLPGVQYAHDTAWQNEFEAEFPYEETPDQLAALQEIKRDMQRPRPMDRLICGDVGFGKTELAIRAAFKACEFGKQVAVLVPTTVLCEQHERTFRSRFAGYPFRIESISRFKTDAEVRDILKELRAGRVDLIIGTHRLLSQDVVFADLGLVVVDEEQRFGVEHKESLLRLRLTVDVLTLSATPIPRTLHMAMLGIRDISSLTTPPADRRAIVTEVIPYNEARIRQAIARELAREGQVYFVHNRVHDIISVADTVQKLAGEKARVVWGHGQMNPHELEEVMLRFMRKDADILVSTTIIESGIDIASANTMIINDADRFGLSDLHQLRGRVGRSKHRAYCYLLLPDDRVIKDTAKKRLKALEQYSMLGAGFKIAMRDLEIRGAGNILGPEQSGHIAAVGYDMYCRLLEQAAHDLKNEKRQEPASSTSVEIGISGLLPKAYIPSDQRRLGAYRRIANATSHEQLAQARADLADAYGPLPSPALRLFDLAELRLALSRHEVRGVTIREKDVVFVCRHEQQFAQVLTAHASTAAAAQASVRALPPASPGAHGEVYFRPPEAYMEPGTLLPVLRRRLGIIEATPPPTPSTTPATNQAQPRPVKRPPPPPGTRAKRV
ncbi:MAG: transcription-repair coupling factor [Phycisphaerales bacterium]